MKAEASPQKPSPSLNHNLFSLRVVLMAMIAGFQKIDERNVTESLEQTSQTLDGEGQELTLDFSAVRRIDSRALRALEELARQAEKKKVHVILHGVNVDLYKTFKLIKLASQFSFVN
jgi:anti-anti-sigma regulatory factor